MAWDNIDAKISSNVQRIVGKELDWHGTLMIAEQMPATEPLISEKRWRCIDREKYPTPLDLVRKISSDTASVSSFNTMFYALLALFRKELMSPDETRMTSMDFLLKLAMKGHCTGQLASISNLVLLDKISNSHETALLLMTMMQKLENEQSAAVGDPEGAIRYCTMAADGPLKAQMERIIRDAPYGERNPDFSSILPLSGYLHLSMAMQDVVKQIIYDA